MTKKILCSIISLFSLVFINTCREKYDYNYQGEYVYQLNSDDIYYFKITQDSIYSLLIPEQYSTGHRYKRMKEDTIELYDTYYEGHDSFYYYISTQKLKPINEDSIAIIDLDLKIIFISRRATPVEIEKYRNKIYEQMISY